MEPSPEESYVLMEASHKTYKIIFCKIRIREFFQVFYISFDLECYFRIYLFFHLFLLGGG